MIELSGEVLDEGFEVPNDLPCGSCGIRVRGHSNDVEPLVFGSTASGGSVVFVTHCPRCRQIAQAAEDLMRGHGPVRARIGSPEIGTFRAESALLALDVAGIVDAATIDALTTTDGEVAKLIDALAGPGGALRWTRSLLGVPVPAIERVKPSMAAWSHVSDELRQEVRDAVGELLARRYERPQLYVPPPIGGRRVGCLLCGVEAIAAKPSEADRLWTAESADPASIGGSPSDTDLEGFACPACEHAIESEHSVGQSAMRHAVLVHLGLEEWARTPVSFSVPAWAITGNPPSATPWAHIDLEALRVSLSEHGVGPLLV